MSKLLTLLWKHGISRRRHFIKTGIIILFPVLIFLSIFSIRQNISGHTIDDTSEYVSEAVSNEYLYDYLGFDKLLYAPDDSQFYNELMKKVADKLRIKHTELHKYHDEDDLLKEKQKEMEGDSRLFAVIFNNAKSPKHLNYTVRSSPQYKTYLIKPQSVSIEPHEQYGYVYQYLSAIQMAIDTTFIEMKSGKSSIKEIWTQPFSYPPYLKDEYQSMKYNYILPMVTICSLVFMAIFSIGDIIREKSCGIKELMNMMGTNLYYFWSGHYIEKLIFLLISTIIIVILLKVGSYPLIPETNVFILYLALFLYGNYVILFSFLICTFSAEVILSTLVLVIIWIASSSFVFIKTSTFIQLQCSQLLLLIPNVPLIWIFRIIGIYETQKYGVQFDNFFSTNSHFPIISFGGIIIWMVFCNILCILAMFYIDQINPGPYGIAKPPSFIFKVFINKRRPCLKKRVDDVECELKATEDCSCIEENKHNINTCIKIRNLTKNFIAGSKNKIKALNKVSLDIYESGITVLLGHNGAGKTTLISILTGIFSPSEGDVTVKDLNIDENIDEVRKCIGLCPQNNITFKDLTVIEHMQFFGQMQGLSSKDAIKNGKNVLQKLQLGDKANEFCGNLSGGAQRRMQLAIALAGNAPVLILDEPTSGLDPENRAHLWNILLDLRKERTILLTTHFMEEADVLGDRVAILDQGSLKCYGTPMFLKNKFYPGYKLTVWKKGNKEDKQSSSKSDITTEIKNKFMTTMEDDDKLECMIPTDMKFEVAKSLDKKMEELEIKSYELSTFSMEDVFFRMCEGVKNENVLYTNRVSDPSIKKNWFLPIKALIFRKYYHIKSNFISYFPMLLYAPTMILMGVIIHLGDQCIPVNKPINLNISLYGENIDIFYSKNGTAFDPKDLISNVNFKNINNSTHDAILEEGKRDITQYINNLVVGLSFDENKYTGHYSISVYHAFPAVINLISNLIAAQEINYEADYPYITTINNPIERNLVTIVLENSVKPESLTLLGVGSIDLAWIFFALIFIAYPVKERVTCSRELQYLTGVSEWTYWFVLLAMDLLIGLIFSSSMLMLLLDPYEMYIAEVLVPVYSVVSLYVLSILAFIYFYSFVIDEPIEAYIYFMVFGILCCLMSILNYVLKLSGMLVTSLTSVIFPTFAFHSSFIKISYLARERAMCRKGYEIFNKNSNDTELYCDTVEGTGAHRGLPDYFGNDGIYYECICMIISTFLYGVLIFLMEYKIYDKIKVCLERKVFNEKAEDNPKFKNYENSLLNLNNVSKAYKKGILYSEPVKSLKGLNMIIGQGDCFGLIGVNGAGKTTTFKIITGDVLPTNGDVTIKDFTLKKKRREYFRRLSYCPQFDAVGDFLTARQALTLFCWLRQVPKTKIDDVVNNVLEISGLMKFADIRSHQYSGGNKRKLSLAIALIGLDYLDCKEDVVVLLDEPTSGVDPKSRLLMRNMIRKVKNSGKTTILSSHNLNECELLCNRIGILVEGQLKYHNGIHEIKKELGGGFTLAIKLKASVADDVTDAMSRHSGSLDSISLDGDIEKNLNGTIKDTHKTMRKYRIPEQTFTYNKLFEEMEKIKDKYDIIEDYKLCSFSLEETFLNFTSKNGNQYI